MATVGIQQDLCLSDNESDNESDEEEEHPQRPSTFLNLDLLPQKSSNRRSSSVSSPGFFSKLH